MSRYQVRIARRATKSIVKAPQRDQIRIRAAIDLPAETPRPPCSIKLSGELATYRVRVGDYRIVYDIVDERLLVQVVRVGHGRDVYRDR